ncbi:MAG: hypothetical protein Q9217_002420 [Psora testacea]
MDVPAKEKRCVAAEGDGAHKGFPTGYKKELDQRELSGPRVALAIAFRSKEKPNLGAADIVSYIVEAITYGSRLTVKQHSIRERVHRPDIRGPIGMTQAPREREKPSKHLIKLSPIPKRSKRASED